MVSKRGHGSRYQVRGGAVLNGSVRISGSANAALASMCAALLTDETVVLENVPAVSDIDSLGALLVHLGATVARPEPNRVEINASAVGTLEAPIDLVSENRASFQVMGPLLARHGFAALPPPGGDVIGQRPIAVHLDGFEAMGAAIDRVGERYQARAPEGLTGTRVFADYPSVSGTQNVMLAASLARGETTIVNAATEPEVQALAALLNSMGARVSGAGTQTINVEGVERLHGTTFALVPDRIEAGTFAIATAMTRGDVELVDAPVAVMDAIITKLRAAGATVEAREGSLRVAAGPHLAPVGFQALPYPGLATDLHAPMAALLTQADGVSIIHERVFDNRMLYVDELRKMGAEIISTGSSAVIRGPTPLHGVRARALDVRAGAAVLLAGLAASGTTVIDDIYHLDRKYERLDEKLHGLGAELERV